MHCRLFTLLDCLVSVEPNGVWSWTDWLTDYQQTFCCMSSVLLYSALRCVQYWSVYTRHGIWDDREEADREAEGAVAGVYWYGGNRADKRGPHLHWEGTFSSLVVFLSKTDCLYAVRRQVNHSIIPIDLLSLPIDLLSSRNVEMWDDVCLSLVIGRTSGL